MTIRSIAAADNAPMAVIIRQVMTEFDCVGPGFSIMDPEVDQMYEAYQPPGAAYFVVMHEGVVAGGAGFAALEGGPPGICELRKMYFLPAVRGQGLGQRLLQHCLNAAKAAGYDSMYLETVSQMTQANRLYLKNGFELLDQPLGQTGHGGCNAFYVRPL